MTCHNTSNPTLKKLTLIEGGTHHEVLSNYIHMLQEQSNDIQVYTNSYIWNLLDERAKALAKVTYHVTNNGEDFIPFLFHHKEEIDTSEIVLCTTLDTYEEGKYIKNIFIPPTFLLIHCLNELNNPYRLTHWNYAPDGYFMLFGRILKSLWTKTYFDKRKNFDSFKYLVVPSDIMLEEAKNLPIFSNKVMGIAPFYAIPSDSSCQKTIIKNRLKVVIPGTVNNRTRNYDLATEIISQISMLRPITLTLLGKLNDQSLVEGLHKLSRIRPNFELITFNSEVDATTYENELEHADIALLPFKSLVRHGIAVEYTGKTFLSGSINDVCRTRLPILYPNTTPLPTELNTLGYTFTDVDDAVRILIGFDQAQANEQWNKYSELSKKLNYRNQGENIIYTMTTLTNK